MKVLVIGGAGFLGSHVTERLLADGHTVDVVDDLSSGSLANLAAARTHTGDLKFHHLDASAPELVDLIVLREPEAVVHLALFTGAQSELTESAAAMAGIVSIAEACRRSRVGKLVTAVPGADLYGPLTARESPVKEARGFQPATVRGVAARTVVDVLGVFRERHALEFTVLALGDVYGPRARSGIAAEVFAHVRGQSGGALPDPGRTLDLVFVDDAVDAFVRALARGGGLVVNVGTGTATSVADLVRALRGSDDTGGITRSFGAPTRFALAPVRARIHLGWSPWTTLDDGLRSLAR